jgi:hypothetical protein
LEFFAEGRSQKHLSDIRHMLASGIEIDRSLIGQLAIEHRLAALWETALQSPDAGLA